MTGPHTAHAQHTDHGHDDHAHDTHGHGHGHAGHQHGVTADADRRYLAAALTLIALYMAAEVSIGLVAGSLALLTDAAHMLTDAVSIVLALVAMRLAARPAAGRWTFGYKRAEILSAQVNGITLLVLTAWFLYEAVRRLVTPPDVAGGPVLATALAGIAVNIAAAWLISRANRSSLNVEGAYQHILNDLWAFIATAASGLIVLTTGFHRADAIASLVVAALMAHAGIGLVRESWRILLEAAPQGADPERIGAELAAVPGVTEVHDLHIWTITSGFPALSAHVLVDTGLDCHAVRERLEDLLHTRHAIDHTTLQVDHAPTTVHTIGTATHPERPAHCAEPHGTTHRNTH